MLSLNGEDGNRKLFCISAEPDVLSDVSSMLGRVNKRALVSAKDSISIMEVIGCMASIRKLSSGDGYIASREGLLTLWIGSWDNARLARFFDLIADGMVDGMDTTEREQESLRTLSSALKKAHEYQYSPEKKVA